MVFNKIFGIGLSKTGTMSLNKALEILGIHTIHYPTDKQTYEELSNGNYHLSILKACDGITDITVSPFYAQLDKAYPNSGFILTTRDAESWLQSISKHYDQPDRIRDIHQNRLNSKLRRFLRAAVYGTYRYNRDRMEYVFRQHEKDVRGYFSDKPNKLLILDISDDDKWGGGNYVHF